MPKHKQFTFQQSIPGKFIPRNPSSFQSVYPIGAHDNRLNAKMAELLASSSILSDENHDDQIETTNDEKILSDEIAEFNSSQYHSNVFHRRIANAISSLRKPDQEGSTTHVETSSLSTKSRPITFGQLRQATNTANVGVKPHTKFQSSNNPTKEGETTITKDMSTVVNETSPVSSSSTMNTISRSHPKEFQVTFERLTDTIIDHQTPLTLPMHNSVYQKNSRVPNEFISRHHQINMSNINSESSIIHARNSNNFQSLRIQQFSTPSVQASNIDAILPTSASTTRPPPPPYESCNRLYSTNEYVVPSSSLPNPVYSTASTSSHSLLGLSTSIDIDISSTSQTSMNIKSHIRSPPPDYASVTGNSLKPPTNTQTTGTNSFNESSTISNQRLPKSFDREFSRLLYGKDQGKRRRLKHRRKAFSDPVKKSIEEAHRFFGKSRRFTTHLSTIETDKELDDETDSSNPHQSGAEISSLSFRRSPSVDRLQNRVTDLTRRILVPPQPALKRRIPAFLRVYSKATSSHDILLQWHLFDLTELESFCTMMSRLYKSENLARVQLYEIYRTALLNILASKQSVAINP